MSAKSNELSDGWIECLIEGVVGKGGIFKDGDWVESKDQDPDGDVRLIQLADVGDGRFVDKSSRFLTKSKARKLNCTFLRAGDILVARMPDPLGRCCIFPLAGDEQYVTVVDICAIRFGDSCVNAKFMMYLINSPSIREKISALQSGSTRKRISRGNLATIPLPIPPLDEQHRIVAKIETLFSELDKGVESLKTAREQLKVYRQAVLDDALDKSASPRAKKISLSKLIGDISQGWSPKCELNRSPRDDEWAVIKTTALQPMKYISEECKPLPEQFQPRPKIEVKSGDFLMTRKGPRNRTGVVCLVRATRKKSMLCDTVYRFRCNESLVYPDYLELALNSPSVVVKWFNGCDQPS